MLTLRRQHAAVPGCCRSTSLMCSACEGDFCVVGKRTVAHPGDHDWDVQLDRFLGMAGAEHRLCATLLAVAFQRDARKATGHEREVVERRPSPRPQGTEAADAI